MNKTYVIAGGVSIASMAIGAAGGYLIARKNFNKTLDEKITEQVDATKKHYSILLMQKDKPADITDIPVHDDEPEVEEEVEETDPVIVERGQKALVNYQGYAEKPELSTLTPSNIFNSTNKTAKPLPPRDPSTGHFLPRDAGPKKPETTPYPITEVEFLTNDPGNEQDSVLFFVKDNTCVVTADFTDVVDNDKIGEAYLSNMLANGEDVIYIRNEGLGMDYQVTLTEESLTEALGLGESEDDMPDDEEEEDDAEDARQPQF